MTDELERLRVQLRDTRKKPVAGDFWQAVEEYEQAVRRDERAQMPCYRIWTGGFTPCVPSGPLCPSCAARAEQEASDADAG